MKLTLPELEALVRRRVCAICEVKTAQGGCEPEEPESCKLFELFPLVAQAILATDSDEIDDYSGAIRQNVCSVCLEQALDGSCHLRGQVRCALDAHLGTVVEAIEEATGKIFHRKNLIA